MANYLVTRASLRGVVLLCDPRHGMTELDDILLEVIRPRVESGLKFLVLLTKADKLKPGRRIQGSVHCQAAGRRRRSQVVLCVE
jgi:GTP-binding protein